MSLPACTLSVKALQRKAIAAASETATRPAREILPTQSAGHCNGCGLPLTWIVNPSGDVEAICATCLLADYLDLEFIAKGLRSTVRALEFKLARRGRSE
jgi:hypothetical protein